MAKEFLGRGWKFPVNVNSAGEIEPSEYEEDIRRGDMDHFEHVQRRAGDAP